MSFQERSAVPPTSSQPSAPADLKIPEYRVHKASGQAYVNAWGRRVYFGRDGLPDTTQKYHAFIAEFIAHGGQQPVEPEQITVKELIARFWLHAEQYYIDADGNPSTEIEAFRYALKPVKELFAEARVTEFGPRALQVVRQRMIDYGWCRSYINKHIVRVKGVFRWGVENELIPGSVYHALQAVSGLRRGRGGARESEPVRPVPMQDVNAIEPFVSRQVWALVQLQLLTGARAGELVALRPCDVNTTGHIWTYSPDDHKTAHHGHRRTIYFGPRAQDVLQPFLNRRTDADMFSPVEAEAERRSAMHASRQTPLSCGNVPGSNRRRSPKRSAGKHYTTHAYRRAIARGCDHAFPPPEPLAQRDGETVRAWHKRLTADQKRQLTRWQSEHRWHPHQLRHNAATELRKEFGIEVARIILGHRSAAITEVYAELDQAKAIEAMARVG